MYDENTKLNFINSKYFRIKLINSYINTHEKSRVYQFVFFFTNNAGECDYYAGNIYLLQIVFLNYVRRMNNFVLVKMSNQI